MSLIIYWVALVFGFGFGLVNIYFKEPLLAAFNIGLLSLAFFQLLISKPDPEREDGTISEATSSGVISVIFYLFLLFELLNSIKIVSWVSDLTTEQNLLHIIPGCIIWVIIVFAAGMLARKNNILKRIFSLW